jgi:hypothetical protein
MGLPKRKRKRMYAVSCEGVGLIAGTLGYSRRSAIGMFLDNSSQTWGEAKAAGYRTVQAMVEIITQDRRIRR